MNQFINMFFVIFALFRIIFFAVGPLDVEMTALKGKFLRTYCSHFFVKR